MWSAEQHGGATRRGRRPASRSRLTTRATAGLVVVSAGLTGYLAADSARSDDPPADDPAPAVARPAAAPVPDGELILEEEFEGEALDTSVWEPYHSTYGHANNELQCHTPDNVRVSNGTLRITARRERTTCPSGKVREFSSGFLGTRETGTFFPRFGRFEIRARVPHGQGLWPAFWLRHRDGAKVAEVDVMEYFHARSPGATASTLHLGSRKNAFHERTFVEPPTDHPGWHTWAVDIRPVPEGVQFTFSVDDDAAGGPLAVHRFVDAAPTWSELHPDGDLWDMAVNLSVGGAWVGDPDGALGVLESLGRCAKGPASGGGCDSEGVRRASFPATFEIDRVRVYRHADGTTDADEGGARP